MNEQPAALPRRLPAQYPERLVVPLPAGTLARLRSQTLGGEPPTSMAPFARDAILRRLAANERRQGRAVVDAAHEVRS